MMGLKGGGPGGLVIQVKSRDEIAVAQPRQLQRQGGGVRSSVFPS